ncbi:C-type mannose receptor 2 [Anabarilius grahami]|uniref:C-type mannose receptor 2 n=1 Tax=Anabarilius grahami TaxID=495550 RepID=A0A3N0YMT4_ANAGA|nr:C-type mannose receptor 2 [Anabarilius grahami]
MHDGVCSAPQVSCDLSSTFVFSTGFFTLTLCVPHYVFVNESKTWPEAQRYCRDKYTDLATIDNAQQTNQLLDTVNDDSIDLAWIGLYDDLNSWKWTLEDSGFFNGGGKEFQNWYNPGPGNSAAQNLCVYMYYGIWYTASCSNSFYPTVCYDASSHQYHFVNESKNWTEAQTYCRENYTDLATIDNMEEMNSLINTVNGSYSGSAWIGQYDDVNSWRWSLEDDDFYQEGERDFRNWYHEPDNDGGNQLCVYMSYDGKWYDMSCDNTLTFVCYDGRENATQSYIRIYDGKTWSEARRYCRDHYTDLTNVRNQTENEMIFGVSGGQVWIGLYRNRVWSNNQTTSYQNWRPQIHWSQAQPDNGNNHAYEYGYQHCTAVSFRYSGRWTDEICVSSMPFLCYSRRANASASYVFVYQSNTWTEAQSYCREHHTDLVSIRNEIENYRVQSLVQSYYTVWIGLYRTRSWSDQSNSSFSNWRTGQPDNAGNSEYCTAVSFSDSGNWTDENCDTALPFICYSALASPWEYHFVNESKTWTEAQRFCRQNYTDLATIDNMEEMNSLINTVNGSYNGSAWIGQYDDVNSWRWSLEDNDFYQEEERDFRNWFHEPNNNAGNELCVYMDPNGNWYDSSCDSYYTFVCYDGRENASQKYVMIYTSKTWTEAQSYCREMYTDLASVRDETERQQILSTLYYYYSYYVWIGLHRNRLWSDQSSSSFTYWQPYTQGDVAQPDNGANVPGQLGAQHCTAVSLKYFGPWTDESCFASLPFFCYSVMGMRIEVTSLENLSESQIEELVIIQLQEELIRLGLPSNATMHLRDYRKIKP